MRRCRSRRQNYKEARSLAAVFADHLDPQSPTQHRRVNNNATEDQANAADAARENVPTISSSNAYDLERVEVEAQAAARLLHCVGVCRRIDSQPDAVRACR